MKITREMRAYLMVSAVKAAFNARVEAVKSKLAINKILSVATTDKKLQELSPELYAFLPKQVADKNLPTSTEDVDFVRAVLGGK